MISLLFRTFTISVLFLSLLFTFFYLLFGVPNEENWGLLWELYYDELPLYAIFVIGTVIISFCISLWWTIAEKSKEIVTLHYVKHVAEPEFSVKRNISYPLRKALTETNELIETQRKSLQRLSNEKAEASDKIIQERIIAERQRLARELHDSVSQQLFAASMLLSAITEIDTPPENAKQTLLQIEKIVQQAQLEMRALLLHLRPIALNNNTLSQGLKELIIELKEKVNVDIEYHIEEIQLTKAEEDHLFRIAQEALSNTLRHAKATEVELLLIERDGLAILRIQDNGRGFDMNEEANSTSYGLKNIAERAVEIGGKYKIVSVPGEGTIVEVKVPLEKDGNEEEVPLIQEYKEPFDSNRDEVGGGMSD